jgi:nitrogen regulatory protein P-II 1
MQLITAVVAPSRINAVLRGLRTFGVRGWILSTVYALGSPPVAHVRLELVAANADSDDVVRVVMRAAGPPMPRVWVTPLDLAVRIRNGERGPDAVQ